MYDSFKRNITYLRVSVTDRCNLRCNYCMPEEGIGLLSHNDILSLEEIAEIIKISSTYGITKVRLTGGEPLVRKGITDLVRMVALIPGIEDLALTTNGILLKKHSAGLKNAGLNRINISLDTLNPERFYQITRGGKLEDVLEGIQAAIDSGLNPVKLNCVVDNSSQETDAHSVLEYGIKQGLQVRFIHRMNLRHGLFSVVEGGQGGQCESCNRLRLTANGKLKPCLFNDLEYDVRSIGVHQAFALAVANKPAKGTYNNNGHFYNIGG